jgi:hypothetical protein
MKQGLRDLEFGEQVQCGEGLGPAAGYAVAHPREVCDRPLGRCWRRYSKGFFSRRTGGIWHGGLALSAQENQETDRSATSGVRTRPAFSDAGAAKTAVDFGGTLRRGGFPGVPCSCVELPRGRESTECCEMANPWLTSDAWRNGYTVATTTPRWGRRVRRGCFPRGRSYTTAGGPAFFSSCPACPALRIMRCPPVGGSDRRWQPPLVICCRFDRDV